MEFDPSAPIWSQLLDEFRSRIATGAWPPESKLPSVRDLAVEFGVNPNTVQRALTELDRLGLTTAQRTAGRFVTASDKQTEEERHDLAVAATDTCVTALRGLGLSKTAATRLLGQRWDEPGVGFAPSSMKKEQS